MPTGDILRRLFAAHVAGDDETFRRAALEIADEEQAKNHRSLAADLRGLIELPAGAPAASRRNGKQPGAGYQVPVDREHGLPLLTVEHPELPWSRLVVPNDVDRSLKKVVEENARADLLSALGVQPTRRVLFYGPPGCGKSLAARVIASRLDRPLLTVKLDAIVSSYLGETAANLDRVFGFVESGTWVLLFDEFDAIAKDRSDADEHGELKRVVSALLQMLDRYRGDTVVIAATNHEHLLDSAVWRRFESIVRFPLPDGDTRLALLAMFLRGLAHDETALIEVAFGTEGAAGSDLELIAIDAARRAALSLRTHITRGDVFDAFMALRDRRAALGIAFS